MRPAAKVVGIAIVIVVIVIGLVAYSYTQIQINLVDISYAGIDWAPKSLSTFLKLAVNLLTGNILEAALSLIAGIKLNLIFALTNHGFFPVYIPDLSYDLLVNDVNVGHGTSKVDTTIYPGEKKEINVLQNSKLSSLEPAIASIIDSDGILNLQVKGTGYFNFFGLNVSVPFESSKEISIKDEISKFINNEISKNSNSQVSRNSKPQAIYTNIYLQASSSSVSTSQSDRKSVV